MNLRVITNTNILIMYVFTPKCIHRVEIIYFFRGVKKEFTPKEVEVLTLIVQGKTSQHIADQLGNSLRTIEGIRSNLLRKSQCDNMMELSYFAGKNDIV